MTGEGRCEASGETNCATNCATVRQSDASQRADDLRQAGQTSDSGAVGAEARTE